jgi:uncharacterized protein (TIGR02271 family)
MTQPGIVLVNGPEGLLGTIDTTSWPLDGSRDKALIQLQSGKRILVPLTALVRQDDGSYRVQLDVAELERRHETDSESQDSPVVLPVIHQALQVETRPVETGRVRVRKVVHAREEVVDPPLLREEVVIERVPVNRVVEGEVSVRTEGDCMIIPVVEEVLVVEKRLLLKEEVHLTKRRMVTHQPQRVTLRREEAVVERVNSEEQLEQSKIEEHSHGKDRHRSV